MKFPAVFIFILSFLVTSTTTAQQMACCSKSASQEFAALGSDAGFRDSHGSPRITNYQGAGEMISFETSAGEDARAFFIPARVPTNKYLFIFHEWWGLNNNIKQEAQKYFDDLDQINIMAIDLYDGETAQDREKARKLMQDAEDGRIRNIIKGAVDYAGDNADIATVGWCYGGGWALQTAIMLGDQADGCVMYYGMPEKDVERLKKLQTPVLGIFAINDPWISQEVVTEFRENMDKADRSLEVITFDANHAFANPSNENYNNVAAGKAYEASVRFIRGQLNLAN